MRKIIIPNKLNRKLQAHARICEENKEKNDCRLKCFAVKGLALGACKRTVMLWIQAIFPTRIVHNIKVSILYKLKLFCVCFLAIVMETSVKNLR